MAAALTSQLHLEVSQCVHEIREVCKRVFRFEQRREQVDLWSRVICLRDVAHARALIQNFRLPLVPS